MMARFSAQVNRLQFRSRWDDVEARQKCVTISRGGLQPNLHQFLWLQGFPTDYMSAQAKFQYSLNFLLQRYPRKKVCRRELATQNREAVKGAWRRGCSEFRYFPPCVAVVCVGRCRFCAEYSSHSASVGGSGLIPTPVGWKFLRRWWPFFHHRRGWGLCFTPHASLFCGWMCIWSSSHASTSTLTAVRVESRGCASDFTVPSSLPAVRLHSNGL